MIDAKPTLRAQMRKQLQGLSRESICSKSQQICHHLEQSNYLNTADPILTFAALPDEPHLLPLFEKLSPQYTFCFPRVTGAQLEIRHVSDSSDLIPGYANILEPSPENCPLLPTENLRIILLPGLAFDPSTGARLGKGKGFYDRLLCELRSDPISPLLTIGICFSNQLTEVTQEAHDQNVDIIITEQGLLKPG